jgi:stress response protein YsnF
VDPEAITVRDASGHRYEAELVDRRTDGSLTVRWPDGGRSVVPATAIERREGADVHLSMPVSEIRGAPEAHGDVETIPLVAEEVVVDKRSRDTTVRVRTHTHEREEEIDETLRSEHVDVKRVPIERYVDEPAVVREEGATTIVPIHEEVLVVEKRLLLKEELHVTKREEARRETHRVDLRTQSAEIERTEPDES